MTAEFAIRALTGTWSLGWMRPMNFDRTKASSRAKAHVRRDEVC